MRGKLIDLLLLPLDKKMRENRFHHHKVKL